MILELQLAGEIERWLESAGNPALESYLSQWPHFPSHSASPTADVAATPAVLRYVSDLPAGASRQTADLVDTLCAAAPLLAWRQTYTAAQTSSRFLDNYAWSEVFGANGPLHSENIACGFLLLGPSTDYPNHRHEAEEVYLPLSGTAAWLQGDRIWRDRTPPTPIFHAGDESHAMRTSSQPLLALYLWRSANLAQKAQLD
jgi:Dimethlysulfonioproprionate lyase